MTHAKKTPSSPKKTSKKIIPTQPSAPTVVIWWRRPFVAIRKRRQQFLARRPHRSFLRTRRRDYVRSLEMPGYWSFTNSVRQMLWRRRGVFIWTVGIYTVLSAVLVGVGSQDIYTQLGDALRQSGDGVLGGNLAEIGNAGLLLVGGASGILNAAPSPVQQVFGVLLVLLVWLTTVWLLRAFLAGHQPRFRDALYSAGAPIISTGLVALVLVIQLLPVALAAIAYSAASASGLLSGGVEAMVFWAVAGLLTVLSVYWITSTFIALIVVTLPGMYPMKAIKTAGDLVVGRRLRILLRLLWLGLSITVLWLVIMLPLILFDTWIKSLLPGLSGLPLIPAALAVMSSLTVVWSASYVYMLYRRIVDDDAAPAL